MPIRPTLQQILLPAFLVVALLPLLLHGLLDHRQRQTEALLTAREAARQVAMTVAASVSTQLAAARSSLEQIAPRLQGGGPAGVPAPFRSLAWLAPDRVLARWPEGPPDAAGDAALLALVQPFFARGESAQSGIVRDPYTGKPTVIFTQPVGTRLAVGLMELEPLLALHAGSTFGLSVRDRAGTRLVAAQPPGEGPGDAIRATVPGFGWTVSVSVPGKPGTLLPPGLLAVAALAALSAATLGLWAARLAGRSLAAVSAFLTRGPQTGQPVTPPLLPRFAPVELEALQRAAAAHAREAAQRLTTAETQIAELRQQLAAASRNLEQANHELSGRRFIDDLTRLSNRRALWRRLSDLERTSPHTYTPVQVLLFRLANFQAIQDRFGPQAADRVLARVAAILERESRGGDFVVRYGTAEFLVLLRRCPAETAQARAQAMRVAVLAEPLRVAGQPVELEVCVGTAQADGGLSRLSFTQLMQSAQRALECSRSATTPARQDRG